MPRWGRFSMAGCAIAAAVFALLLARASTSNARDTADASEAAAKLIPFRADYLVQFAAWHPAVKQKVLQRAVALDPFETQAWIDLGLDAEFNGRSPNQAEQLYLRAEGTNHMFVPKWTLTNFFYRQQRVPDFLRWAKETLEITPYSAAPVFSEMWLLAPEAPQLLATAVPDNPNTLWQYAWFLSNGGHLADVPPVISRLVEHAPQQDAEVFGKSSIVGPIEDKLLQNGREQDALAVWNMLYEGHWISLPAPNVATPITNGSFTVPIWPHGFDWVVVPTSGVSIQQDTQAHHIEIDFSGDQPDPCTLLVQWVPLSARKTYTVRWSAKAESADAQADLTWHVRTGVGQPVAASLPFSQSGGKWTFSSPPQDGAFVLSLEYARQTGYTRAEGSLLLSEITASYQ